MTDTGTPLGYLKTMFETSMAHPEVGASFRAWLVQRLQSTSD